MLTQLPGTAYRQHMLLGRRYTAVGKHTRMVKAYLSGAKPFIGIYRNTVIIFLCIRSELISKPPPWEER